MFFYQGEILDGAYQIIQEIGRGGTGIVYLAWHLRLRKYVVVKRIRDHFADRIQVRREVDILKSLRHTYLPQVYDFFQHGESVYTVMDYIQGCDLQSYLDQGWVFEEKRLIFWLRQLLEVLSYLHGQSPAVLHCDIKPGNIMITPEGNVCLIDFNISLDESQSTGLEGVSWQYGAPEQCRKAEAITAGIRNEEILDGRMDIYSLGAVFYRLMSGRIPSAEEGANCPLEEWELPYSSGFRRIIDRAMAWDRRKRFQSAEAMMTALDKMYKYDASYRNLQKWKTVLYAAAGAVILAGALTAAYGYERESLEQYWADYQEFQDFAEEYDNEEVIRLGLEMLNRGRYSRILEKNPLEQAEIFYRVGDASFNLENYGDAQRYFFYAREAAPEEPSYYRDEAIAAARGGNLEIAEQVMAEAEAAGMDDANLLLVRGEIALADGREQEAAGYAGQLLEAGGDLSLRASFLGAEACGRMGDAEGQERFLRAASGASPSGNWARKLGVAWLTMAENSGSKAKKQEYLRLAGDCYAALEASGVLSFEDRLNQAILLEQQGDTEAAVRILESLSRQEREDYRVYLHLTYLYYQSEMEKGEEERNFSDMEKAYKKALELYRREGQPEDPAMSQLEQLMNNGGNSL